jgi:very-short-patch-repair endonuclease
MPPDQPTHIIVPAHAGRVRTRTDAVLHWIGSTDPGVGLQPVRACVAQATRCADPAFGFAIVESALRRYGRPGWVREVLSEAPDRGGQLHLAGRASESGTESVAAYRMRRAGIAFRQQVRMPGIGRVDFLVEDRLILEVDSNEFHDQPSHRMRDLRRDAHAAVLDLRSLRLDYLQVLFDWDFSEAAIRAALAHRPGRVAFGG